MESSSEESLPAETWAAVIVLNGDLGKDFPLGRGLPLASGNFRVVLLRYQGTRSEQDEGDDGAIVRNVRALLAEPIGLTRPVMVNVDGLRLMARGTVRVSISGRVRLVDAGPDSGTAPESTDATITPAR